SYRHAEEQEAPAISGRERDRAADDPRGPSVLVARLWRHHRGGLDLHLGAVLNQRLDLDHRHGRKVAAHPGAVGLADPPGGGPAPASRSTASVFSRVCRSCSTRSSDTIVWPASQPIWPATNTSRPSAAMPFA